MQVYSLYGFGHQMLLLQDKPLETCTPDPTRVSYTTSLPKTSVGATMANPQQNITSMLQETRVFPPPKEFAANADISSEEQADALRQEAAADPRSVLGQTSRVAALVPKVEHRSRLVERAPCPMVCRRHHQRQFQLSRSPCRRRPQGQARDSLGRGTRRHDEP